MLGADLGIFEPREVALVDVDGTSYEVGPGVAPSVYGNAGRTLWEDYCTTPNYAALLGGALHFANVSEVELLVLGLPVHTTKKYSARLRNQFSGRLDFGHGKVSVSEVMVIPQVLWSLVWFLGRRHDEFGDRDAHLVIDVGYLNTDWVVAKRFSMDEARSGTLLGGTLQIYQRIAQLISEQESDQFDEIGRIERCLVEKGPLLFYGKDIELEPYVKQSRAIITATVESLRDSVGHPADFRSIVLTGGGAPLYEQAIRAAFPRTQINLLEAPCFGNVNGFLIAGEATLLRERKRAGSEQLTRPA